MRWDGDTRDGAAMPSRGVCDRCGFVYWLNDLRKEWTGLMVCRHCFDHRHPQEYTRAIKDTQGVRPDMRPEPADVYADAIVPTLTFTDSSAADVSAATTSSRQLDVSSGLVVITVGSRGNGGVSHTITGLTVDDVEATLVVASATSSNPTAIFTISVATATTATVIVTASNQMSRCGVASFILSGHLSATAAATDRTIATATSIGLAKTIGLYQVGLWTACHGTTQATTWNAATEAHDDAGTSVHQHSSAIYSGSEPIAVSASAAWSTSSNSSMCFAAWR